MLRTVFMRSGACLAAVSATLFAQTVFVEPGSTGLGQTVVGYSANPFSQITSFSSGTGTFQILEKPDGSKFYAIGTGISQTVTVLNSSFATSKTIDILQAPSAALLSPDGSKLAVAAGKLRLFDTGTDTELIPGGINGGPSVSIFDVAVSLDGKTFFTLGSISGGGSQLNAVDASSFSVTGTLSIQGTATGVAVSRNGLVYVSTQNQIVEVNPVTLAVTPNGTLGVNALPGRLVFLTGGQYALAVNKTPQTGSSLLLINLPNHTVSAPSLGTSGVVLDELYVTGVGTLAAFSRQSQSLYQIVVDTLSSNPTVTISNFPAVSTNVSAVAVSNEVPSGNPLTAQNIYVVSATGNTLYQIALASGSISGQFTVPSSAGTGALSFAAPISTGTPTSILQYGTSQSVAASATSQPLVIQALDSNGRPLRGVGVTFSVSAVGATVNPTSATTGANGYALTYLTAPSSAGPVIVTATVGSQPVNFNINVTASSGGGGGGSNGGLQILAGQGQILPESQTTSTGANGSPLKVLVTDASGHPIVGASVTFSITQGNGTLLIANVGNGSSVTATSDDKGVAFADFLSSSVPFGAGYVQATVTASTATSSVIFYVTTVPQFAFPPSINLVKPDFGGSITGQAGTTQADGVEVTVGTNTGAGIPNVSVILDNGGLDSTLFPSAKCSDPTGTGVLTDATGKGVCDVVFGGKVGTGFLTAKVGYAANTRSFALTVTPGPPGAIKLIQGNNQTGSPGQRLPLALLVQVTDAAGNALSGIPVTWAPVIPGTVTLSSIFSPTDSNGQSSALATLGNTAGTVQVKVTAGTATATFSLTVNIPATGITKVSGDAQTAEITKAFGSPLVVKVVNSSGAGIAGAAVTFAVTAGSATLGTSNATTDSGGQASTTVTAGSSAGSITITASSPGVPSVTFTLTSRLPGPTNVKFLNGASFQTGISPGGVAIITGNGIASSVQGLVSAFNIVGAPTTTLAGVNIKFAGVDAPIFYVLNNGTQEQIAVQVPFETTPGTAVNVTINAAGGGSATVSATVQPYAPGTFTSVYGSQTLAVAVRPDGSFVSPTNAARRGENIRFYVTGLGQVSPATSTGFAGIGGQTVPARLVVGINNAGVALISAEYAPGLVGVYAVTVQIPTDTRTGSAQPFDIIAYDAQNNPYQAAGTPIPIQ